MDLEHRVDVLEKEVQILKGQIQATLLEIQEHLLTNAYPALRAEEMPQGSAQTHHSTPPVRIQTKPEVVQDTGSDESASANVRRVSVEPPKPENKPPAVKEKTRAPVAQTYSADEDDDEIELPAPVIRQVKLDDNSDAPSRPEPRSDNTRMRKIEPPPVDSDDDDDYSWNGDARPPKPGRQPGETGEEDYSWNGNSRPRKMGRSPEESNGRVHESNGKPSSRKAQPAPGPADDGGFDYEAENSAQRGTKARKPKSAHDAPHSAPTESDDSDAGHGRNGKSRSRKPQQPDTNPEYEYNNGHENSAEQPTPSKGRYALPEETRPRRPDGLAEAVPADNPADNLADRPAEGGEAAALNRLAEWVGTKVSQIGTQRTRDLIELNAQKGHFTEEFKGALLQLVNLYNDDGSIDTDRLDSVLNTVVEPPADASDDHQVHLDENANQELILRLIAGIQNAGAGISWRKKNG